MTGVQTCALPISDKLRTTTKITTKFMVLDDFSFSFPYWGLGTALSEQLKYSNDLSWCTYTVCTQYQILTLLNANKVNSELHHKSLSAPIILFIFFIVSITTVYKGATSQTATFAVSILVTFIPEGLLSVHMVLTTDKRMVKQNTLVKCGNSWYASTSPSNLSLKPLPIRSLKQWCADWKSLLVKRLLS